MLIPLPKIKRATKGCLKSTDAPLFFVVIFPGNSIGDEGATALAGALVEMKSLREFELNSACVLQWYAFVVGSNHVILQCGLDDVKAGGGVQHSHPHSDPQEL